MDVEESKYTRVEFERRFLVSSHSDWRAVVESYSKTFEDKYLHHARLRLRVLTDSDTGRRIIKLTKKFESESPYFQTIGRILLSPGEYELFDALPGDRSGRPVTTTSIEAGCSRSMFSRASSTGWSCVK